MKKIFFAVLSFIMVTAHAQTADDIIQKYTANMGGLDAFNKITSCKMTGNFTAQGQDFAMTIQIINGKASRSDVDIMGQSVTNCYYNGKGWKINPFAGVPTAVEVTGNELSDLKIQSNLANPLMDYKARGNQVELLGDETIGGVKAYKIKLTSKEDGRVITYFIGSADYVLIKSVTTRNIQGQDKEVESYYSDLKEINGVKFFMSRSSQLDGEEFQSIKFDKIELNVPIDEKIFEMPK